jgi:REP-associated tyrosine transposase
MKLDPQQIFFGTNQLKHEYLRHLPHQVPAEAIIFLTWNLKGAMPKEVAARIRRERGLREKDMPGQAESIRERKLRLGKLEFKIADEFLDNSTVGPLYLRDALCAEIVEESILFGANDRYELFSWSVMPNHVHMLLRPFVELAKLTQGIKGFTSRAINRMQNQTGRTLWQDESYDHWVRDDAEFHRIIHYIEENPVKAGLCGSARDWNWSSARFRPEWSWGIPYHTVAASLGKQH